MVFVSVEVFVVGVVGVGSGVDEGIVEFGFFDVGVEVVDFFEGGVWVCIEGVGIEVDEFVIFFVYVLEFKMVVVLLGVVEYVGIGEFG